MANSVQIQTLVDSERNLVVKLVGLLDTSNVSLATLIDPALVAAVNASGLNSQQPTKVAIKKVTYDCVSSYSCLLSSYPCIIF
jgi:hypothetical protein